MNSTLTTLSSSRRLLATLAGVAAFTTFSRAAVTVQFGETEAPSANVIAFYNPISQGESGWLNSGGTDRIIGESFVLPAGISYNLNSVTMKLAAVLGEDFTAPSGFTIDFYELPNDNSIPVVGSPFSSQAGTMQPTISQAPAGSYFTFSLDSPVLLEAGKTYSYVLGFDDSASYNWLRMAVSAGNTPNPAGGYAWQNTNNGGWTWLNESRVYYLQGAAVPEPASLAFFALAGIGYGLYRFRRTTV